MLELLEKLPSQPTNLSDLTLASRKQESLYRGKKHHQLVTGLSRGFTEELNLLYAFKTKTF